MIERDTRTQDGFSLLEALIGLSLFLIALSAIGVALDSNRRSYVRGTVRMDLQQGARMALSGMATEIRLAGYFPENFTSPPADPLFTNAVQIASHDAIAVYGDADGSGTSSVFLYCLDGTTLRRGKAPDGVSTAYWCPAGEVLAENITSLTFAYFDQDGLPIPSSPTAPYNLDNQAIGSVPAYTDVTQRSAVRRVLMTVTLDEDIQGMGTQTFDIGSEVRLRNVQ